MNIQELREKMEEFLLTVPQYQDEWYDSIRSMYRRPIGEFLDSMDPEVEKSK